ncbi:phosphoglycolate phosphatase [Aequitasia blattaphilus]|uniref:HAD family hydrolase n=1 Tax=Aequitasia blattaphilus TaxID=2949332 RepID=A0ABT1E9Z5_9FIRM|nr:HAD family hydrolase [Aequitasia blattaphilus]MCP1101332.1 HAD family hydrolase [Aequitasia blattaphilus]MCR8613972.1 HAD family hydrolase [Aequitasia blattaphilus]
MKACIFDLDGTLANTLESLVYSVEKTLKEMNLPMISKQQCCSFVGNGARVLLEKSIAAAGADQDRIEEAIEIYIRIFDEHCTYHVESYSGVEDTLKQLKSEGYKLAVLSNKPHRQTQKVIYELYGEDFFDAVYGQRKGVERKPSPAPLLEIVEEMKLSKEDCVYIGDSEVDVKTGHNAQLKTIAVTWGFREKSELEAAGAKKLVDSPEELYQCIKAL